ncbi:Hcp family type VI secretion system effector [Cellulomonas sp. URHB0016]
MSNAFLRLDSVPGGSVDRSHRDWIDVRSMRWSEAVSGPGLAGAGAGAGKVEARPVQLTSSLGVASPLLFLACARGTHVPTATLEIVHAGGRPAVVLRWELHDVTVASYELEDDVGAGEPVDTFSLSFRTLSYSYLPQGSDGNAGAPVTAGWDFGRHVPV